MQTSKFRWAIDTHLMSIVTSLSRSLHSSQPTTIVRRSLKRARLRTRCFATEHNTRPLETSEDWIDFQSERVGFKSLGVFTDDFSFLPK
jgi:hypothetical protein